MARLTDRTLPFPRFARACKGTLPAAGAPSEASHSGGRTRSIVRFAAGCSALVGAALLIIWALTGFADLGVHGHVLVAMMLGIVFTTGLGCTLMALIFYSDRDEQRDGVDRPDGDGFRDAD